MKQKKKKVSSPVAKYMNQYCKPSSIPSKKHSRGNRFGKYKKNAINDLIEEEEEEEEEDITTLPPEPDSHDQEDPLPHNA